MKTYCFTSKEEIIRYINDKKILLIAINAEKIINTKYSIHNIVNNNIGYPDGIAAVWALRKNGFRKAVKIPGVELWLDIIKKYYNAKSFYIIGSKKEVIQETILKLKEEFPGIKILNFRDGYINTQKEKDQLFSDIKIKKPDIVFVATGSPRQELLMQELYNLHSALYMGLGGSFDVYTHHVRRAPKFIIWLNLEWLYRVAIQPKRINRLFYQVKFVFFLILNKI